MSFEIREMVKEDTEQVQDVAKKAGMKRMKE
ncbi:hypothetical protein DFR57_102215 [Saliterribacillus persicus]|uniref:Uncharacterized protein n=1 Tax=Saliterribacillus persicus TaxID=930114 RepID=A0A368Y9J4_9BACI|nr:hypothetical protein DFR57_102215 [Saliterribacillus persicus]